MELLIALIPALPLAGFLVNGIFGKRLSKSAINVVAVGSVLLSFLWVVKTLLAEVMVRASSKLT